MNGEVYRSQQNLPLHYLAYSSSYRLVYERSQTGFGEGSDQTSVKSQCNLVVDRQMVTKGLFFMCVLLRHWHKVGLLSFIVHKSSIKYSAE